MRGSYRYRIIAVIVLMAIVVSALASAFDQVQFENAFKNENRWTEKGSTAFMYDGRLVVDSSAPPLEKLFEIEGYLPTAYLRTNVFNEYTDSGWAGSWTYDAYDGRTIETVSKSGGNYNVKISPTIALGGNLPVVRNTYQVEIEGEKLAYCNETQTFATDGMVNSTYTLRFVDDYLYTSQLSTVPLDAGEAYVQVPEALRDRLSELVGLITDGVNTPYEKVIALQTFLQSRYQYSLDYPHCPAGADPVEWFLFNSNQGVCTHFNSALVLMVRCLDIPARVCSGYLVNGYSSTQVVYSGQAHAYAEVMLAEGKWAIFDATPGAYPNSVIPDNPYQGNEMITGHIYSDLDGNGYFDYNTDSFLSGRSVALYDSAGTMLEMNTSDAYGYYILNCPEAGQYSVRVFFNESENVMPTNSYYVYISEGSWYNYDFYIQTHAPPTGTGTTTIDITSVTGTEGSAYPGGASLDKGTTMTIVGVVGTDAGPVNDYVKIQLFLTADGSNGTLTLIGEAETWYGGDGSFTASCRCPWSPGSLEPGAYQLIARTLRDNQRAPAEDRVPVTIIETTKILLQGDSRFFADQGTIVAVIVAEGSTGWAITNADLMIDLPGYGVVNTGPNGYIWLTFPPCEPGNITFTASFAGKSFYSPSSSEITLKALTVQLDVTNARMVRGEYSNVIGRVHAEGLSTPTYVYLNVTDNAGNTLFQGSAYCDVYNRGIFTLLVTLPFDIDLGRYYGEYVIGGGDSRNVTFDVVCRPDLNVTVDGRDITARLVDDNGKPMANQELLISTGTGSRTASTDERGVAHARLDDGSSNATVIYSGSSVYLSAKRSVVLGTIASSEMGWALPLAAATVIAALLMAFLRWRSSQEDKDGEDDDGPQTGPYRVIPAAAGDLPLVWGESEPVVITVEGKERTLKLLVDGRARRVRSGSIITLELTKGEHIVEVRGILGRRRAKVRVVNYREEVARIFLRTEAAFPDASNPREPSAQEFLSTARGKGEIADPNVLVKVFERAEYSVHDIERPDYEQAYHSSKKVSR